MIFNSIQIEEAGVTRIIDLSDKNNLVHSATNSKGKTTLLRLLLYSIGYSIPNTKHIKFEDCNVEVCITIGDEKVVSLYRESRDYIIMRDDDTETTYILPSQETELHKKLFNADNIDLINNLLGTFYFDQEKGWTLLNRGVVIGSLRFNIEELIRGIANIDCSELIKIRDTKKQNCQKYQQMFSVAKYQATLDAESKNLAVDSYNNQVDSKINQGRIQQNMLKKELARIDGVLRENKHFKKFIAEIGLLIKTPTNETIAVTERNIVGLNDAINFLIAKRKIIASQYNHITTEIEGIEKEYKIEEQQQSFFDDVETIADIFDRQIANIPVNETAVKKGIDKLKKDISDINSEIKRLTRTAHSVITPIYNNTKKYLNELGLNGKSISEKYLFTSNLKELSGAILHKTVFAFRLACLLEVEKHLSIKLPIILDSPSGKEIDQQNIEAMINILNRDFSDNQIIIASIYEYNLTDVNKIEIVDRLIQ